MDAKDRFVEISGLICEPARLKMLWSLLDGKAYTATELAMSADISSTSASNHLAKMRDADIVKVEVQGRHRYYSYASAEVAYAVEALAGLAGNKAASKPGKNIETGVKYCRTCYDHLAGFVGVSIIDALQKKKLLKTHGSIYKVTDNGWKWFESLNIFEDQFINSRRPLARQCLDWSERRSHLAGQLGAVLLQRMMERKWFRKVQFSRELVITATGRKEIFELLRISV